MFMKTQTKTFVPVSSAFEVMFVGVTLQLQIYCSWVSVGFAAVTLSSDSIVNVADVL